MAQTQQNKQVSAGDFTGQQKKQQAKEAQQEQRDRAHEMTMASVEEDEAQATGVFDPRTQERIGGEVEEVEVVDAVSPGGRAFGESRDSRERVFTGYESDEEMEPFLATQETPSAPEFLLREPYVRIRTNTDIDNMTYGFVNGEPNNMSFKEGYLYEVRVDIADHLNQRGVIGRFEGTSRR
jgi:hypothetical protein